LSGGNDGVSGATGGNLNLQAGTGGTGGHSGAINIGTTTNYQINLGDTTSTTIENFNAGRYGVSVSDNGLFVGSTSAAPTADLLFGSGFTRKIAVQTPASGAGNDLDILAGGGAGTSAGGNLVLQAGAGGASNSGNVIVKAQDNSNSTSFQIQNST